MACANAGMTVVLSKDLRVIVGSCRAFEWFEPHSLAAAVYRLSKLDAAAQHDLTRSAGGRQQPCTADYPGIGSVDIGRGVVEVRMIGDILGSGHDGEADA